MTDLSSRLKEKGAAQFTKRPFFFFFFLTKNTEQK